MGLFPTHDPHHQAIYAEEAAMVDASELIAHALEASGLSRADLARKLNVTRSEVTERLRGDRNITVRNLAATLHALGSRLDLRGDIPVSKGSSHSAESDTYRRWANPAAHQAPRRSDRARASSYRALANR